MKSNNETNKIALVTGASSGIGAIYADRLANRGYDLILVARNRERLEISAARLMAETGRNVEAVAADLTEDSDLARVEGDTAEQPPHCHVGQQRRNRGRRPPS